jgi:peptidoglycan lytic transglycosylase
MRTLISSALAVATLGLMTLSPASAATHWECMGGALACSGSPAAFARTAYNTRARGRTYASREERRVSSRRTRSYRVANRAEPTQRRSNNEAASFSKTAYSGGSYSGMASYYGSESGSRTASGAHFNPGAMTAAHRTLPFGTKVRVTNRRNGRSVIVTINDRGPFVRGRVIDLSSGAAGVIGMRSSGVAPVSVEVLGRS